MNIQRKDRVIAFVWACVVGAVAACASNAPSPPGTQGTVASELAAFTTFDTQQGGCLDGPNGVNCNNYVAKEDVYASGGPAAAGLDDGNYFFAVLVPGFQNGGFVDGADGNLSDTTAGATAGDLGSGDLATNRTFTVQNHEVVAYGGTHATGTSPGGRVIIRLAPFDTTSNPAGVYILALCRIGATSPSQCAYDSFNIQPVAVDAGPPPPDAGAAPVVDAAPAEVDAATELDACSGD
jgi:hypothetical protein